MKFSKEANKQIDALAAEAGVAYTNLEKAVIAFNEELEAAREKVTGVLGSYNAARGALHDRLQEEKDQFDGEFEDHADKWKEGEKGEAASAFISEIEEVLTELDEEVELELPEDVELSLNNPEELVNNLERGSSQ